MLQIIENIQWDKTKPLVTEQSQEFQDWFNVKVGYKAFDYSYAKSNDQYGRPYVMEIIVDEFIVNVYPQYQVESDASHARSGHNITITRN